MENKKWDHVLRDRQHLAPLQNPNLSTDCEKIVTVDYIRETKRHANLGVNPSTRGFLANG